MKRWAITSLAVAVTGAPLASTTLYGEANATLVALAQQEGTTLQVQDVISSIGYRGNVNITNTQSAVFDLEFDVFSMGNFATDTSEAYIGIQGEFGRAAFFYGETPVSRTNDYLEMMDEDPVSQGLILGAGSSARNVLALGIANDDGLRYTSPELEGGLSFDSALMPSDEPDVAPGFGMAVTLRRNTFQVTGAAQINVDVEQTQLLRAVGEYYLGRMTLGGLFQVASNSELDIGSSSVAGYFRMPLDITPWDTRLQLLAGTAGQSDQPGSFEESQVFASALHEIRMTRKVSTYSFIESYMAEDDADDHAAAGFGMRVKF